MTSPARRSLQGTMVGAAVILLLACQPGTTRPAFPPVPESVATEVRLPPREATRLLAQALQVDSIPATRVFLRDSWFDSGWFDPRSGRPTHGRPVGPQAVRVRGWADPTHPGNSKLFLETVYRPLDDASLPERELDREVPRDHPVAVKTRAALAALVKRYGGPPAPIAPQAAPPGADDGAQPPDSAPADTTDAIDPE